MKSIWKSLLPSARKNAERPARGKSLSYEPLEPRIALSAAGLVDVGTQPEGALSGKIVYTHGGHGITGDYPDAGDWSFQRPLLLNMIEDLGNQDQMTFFSEYLFQAGATVVPLRPVGHQPNEVVLDNDDTEVTFTGAWSDSSSPIYFGDPGDVPYRFASTSVTETATANYRPDIPEDGFYPVYSWTRYGSDRASDFLYKINHSGGTTEVTVDHTRVGNGTVYLGTYHFEAGTAGSVDISNRSDDAGTVVIADMIRFGNGVGDVQQSGTITGRDRTDEAGLYWVEWHVDHSQGISSSEYRSSSDDRTATVSLSPRYSEYMNREQSGSLSDRVFVSFHSNAGSGSNRGVLGLYNSPSGATPNQFLLADTLAREVNDDLVDQNGEFEHNWFDRGSIVTLDRSDIDFGEINNSRINNEFDATIIETGFHDNAQDADLLRDPKVRDALARATYQGTVKYFNSVDGGATPVVMLPGRISELSAEAVGSGSATVSWSAPLVSDAYGDAPTGYMVYGSTNGYGFDGGTFVAGGATTNHTFHGLDPNEGAYYFKVAAVNAGGEALSSEVVAVLPNGTDKNILIVNGFDRLEKSQNPVQAGADRVRPRQSNSYDYAAQVGAAIEANTEGLVVDTASNEMIISGDIQLTDYESVVWILGEESSADDTFNSTEQSLVASFLSGGGKLFLSGSEVAWDLDALSNGESFYNNSLRASYSSDDAGTYNAQGVTGSIFEGLSLSFDDGSQFYNVDFPDVIAPSAGATSALSYVGGTGGTAAVQYDSGASTKVVNFGFPFETIVDEATRNAVFGRVLDFFEYDVTLSDVELILDNDDGPSVYSETGSWTTSSSAGFNGGTYRFAVAGTAATAQWDFSLPYAGEGEVFAQYLSSSNRTTDTSFQIDTGNGVESSSVDQTSNSLIWVSLGTFDFTAGNHSVVLDAAASTGGSVVIADAVKVVLTAPSTDDADFNSDSAVDGLDFLAWQQSFGTTSGADLPQGDANADEAVDAADLVIWNTQYGSTTDSSVAAVAAAMSPSSASKLTTADASALSQAATQFYLTGNSSGNASHHELIAVHEFFADSTLQDGHPRESEVFESATGQAPSIRVIHGVGASVSSPEEIIDQVFDLISEAGLRSSALFVN
ncbi:golvesin C-terminal-like domain-containing protein [Adhaeretor mobilis]|uniref:AmiA-like protein n=1 Tax=Adhaeretor mobilis TaxID=1930276 RepID=A0A517MTN9_9BACT|nr:N-acetylmuramoyl-L-alanine amidase [Adhaeretor mobilis]QDS98250.1 AmiA-like protein [Adhaeretor mobilis]